MIKNITLRDNSSDSLVGVSASMSEKNIEVNAPVENPILRANKGYYQLYINMYRGGRYVFRPCKGTIDPISGKSISTYLTRHQSETGADFDERLENSFTLPYIREIITTYSSTLFRQDVNRDQIAKIFGREYLSDIDKKGSSSREFLRQCFNLGQIYGWVAVLTDYPRIDEEYYSAYHELIDENRPYSQIITPLRLWDWVIDPCTGQFVYAEIWNGLEGEQGRWRRWTPEFWYDVTADGVVVDGSEHSLGIVPIDVLVCQNADGDDPLAPFGYSAISDAAFIQLHIYQMCSMLEAHDRLTMFSFLHIQDDPRQYMKGENPTAPKLQLGSSHYLWNQGNVEWIDPPTEVSKEAREQISFAVQEMRRAAGVSTRSEESVEAHSGVALSWEYSSRHNAVYERAQNLEDFETRLWRTHGIISGNKVPADVIRYPKEYAIQPVEQEIKEIKELIGIAEKVPDGMERISPLLDQKLRRIVIHDIGHLPIAESVLSGIQQQEKKQEDLTEISQAQNEKIQTKLKISEALVKMKAPDEVVRKVVSGVLSDLGIYDPTALAALNKQVFRWYTEVQTEMQATGQTSEEIEQKQEEDKEPEKE
jgi:hypothetical protein